jgi:hypothetical protein
MKVDKNNLKIGEGVVRLAPSILAADFARLGEQLAEAEQAGAEVDRALHQDNSYRVAPLQSAGRVLLW